MVIVAAVAAAAARWGPGCALAGAFLLWLGRTAYLLAQQPEVNLGHRAGFPGFEGKTPCYIGPSDISTLVAGSGYRGLSLAYELLGPTQHLPDVISDPIH